LHIYILKKYNIKNLTFKIIFILIFNFKKRASEVRTCLWAFGTPIWWIRLSGL